MLSDLPEALSASPLWGAVGPLQGWPIWWANPPWDIAPRLAAVTLAVVAGLGDYST